MINRLRIGDAALAVVCALALMVAGTDVALGAEGTTVTPGEAIFNAALVAETTAVFETPIAKVTCRESSSRGAVPARPLNVYIEESEEEASEETLELPGAVTLEFGTPTFRGCSAPGASSATVSNVSELEWQAAATSDEGDDIFSIEIPQESLRIVIVTTAGTCTIIAPTLPGSAVGDWTNGSRGSASTAVLDTQLEFTASGTCNAPCTNIELDNYFPASFTYSITNAAERGESIVF